MTTYAIDEVKEIPDKVTVAVAPGNTVTVSGPKGQLVRRFSIGSMVISAEAAAAADKKVHIRSVRGKQAEKKLVGSVKAHLQNMFIGVVDGHHYKMRVYSGHFPMAISMTGRDFIIKNFLGEKTPRKVKLPEGVTVKIKGNDIELEGCDKELVGNAASAIEKLARRPNFDRRVYQDAIIIIKE